VLRRPSLAALTALLSLVTLGATMLAVSEASATFRHHSRCWPHGSHTIALNRSVRVYAIPEYVGGVRLTGSGTFACLLHRVRTLQLGPALPRGRFAEPDHVAVAGTFVAFVASQGCLHSRCEAIEVIDVANRRRALFIPNVGYGGKAPASAEATDLVVNEHGSVAWIMQRWMRQPGGRTTAIVGLDVHSATTSGSTALLDSGTGIVPGSLRLAPGGEVSWIDAGRTRYAPLP
jgi:hypothetical protein